MSPEPFTLLFDDIVRPEPELPQHIRAVLGGDWHLPRLAERPYTYANFALSRDGRISFNEPGHLGGGDVSGFNAHDQWLMGLLRARADAVVVGDNTVRLEPEHLWTSSYIYPRDAATFRKLRAAEGRRETPLQVFLSFGGDFNAEANVFCQPDVEVVIATTKRGFEDAKGLSCAGTLTVLALGETSVDLARFGRVLKTDFGVNTLLCEGGPRVYGSFLSAGLMDEEFLALCPTVIGNDRSQGARPGLIEGAAFSHDAYPKSIPISLRRAGDHLFLHSRLTYPPTHT